jgi:hypothetical protein
MTGHGTGPPAEQRRMKMKVKPQSPGSRGTATASTRRMGNIPAGGIGSKVVRREGTRDGSKPTGVNPGAVAQFGAAIGNHATQSGNRLPYKGEEYVTKTPIGVPLGNELAKNVGKGGPGTGREVFACGSQGTNSPTRSPIATGRDILRDFGPDSKK